MSKTLLVSVLLAGAVGVAVADEVVPTSPADAGDASTGESSGVAKAAAPDSQTAKAVAAANAFVGTLSSAQRASVQYSFGSSAKKTGWSNLPVGAQNSRNGIAVGDLSASSSRRFESCSGPR